MIDDIDERHFIDLLILSEISFTDDKAKELLTLLENRKIVYLNIQKYLEKVETEAIVRFLSSPQSIYTHLVLKFANSDDVTDVLRATENKYSLIYAEIDTEEPVSKEAEQLAIEILDTHCGCSLYLNSEVKALRSLESKGITVNWW